MVLPVCLTLFNHADASGRKIAEHHFTHKYVELVHNITNSVTKGQFQIKLNQSDSYMHLKEPKKLANQKWSFKYNRFLNSSKAGKNFYVFSGDV